MIRRAAIRYRDFLRLPDVATMLVVALVTRMPIGTLSLSMLLHVRARAGSFAVAGAAVGAFMAAAAIVAPGVGRVVDRRGPRLILIVTGIVFSVVARRAAGSGSAATLDRCNDCGRLCRGPVLAADHGVDADDVALSLRRCN